MQIAWERLNGRSGHEAGRALLAAMYRRETGEDMPEIQVTPQGKPYFPGNALHFSISHTKDHVFCCLSRKNVGIDAEEMDRRIVLRLSEKVLSPSEQHRYEKAADKSLALLRLWVLKESYAKLTGRGIGSYLYHTDFDPDDPRIREIDGCFVAVMTEE